MLQVYLLLLAGLILLFLSGKFLVDSSIAISYRLKIPRMIVGLTVVAFGTSAPELLVSVQAALGGYPEMAMGNVIGSNISNILLVLALTALIYPIPVPASSVRSDWPVMMGTSALLFFLVLNGSLSRLEGVILLGILIAYILFAIWRSGRQNATSTAGNAADQATDQTPGRSPENAGMGWLAALALFLASCVGLAFGADLLVDNAAMIAEDLGVSKRVISISMVAIGTSIPEVATSVIAALKKETDISVGNIIGSNIMNILSVLGITALFGDISVDEQISLFDIPVMLGVSVLLLLLMLPVRHARISRREGLFMISLYLLYIYFLF